MWALRWERAAATSRAKQPTSCCSTTFGTIFAAIRQGRATFVNARRFLTYHLTDNVAELAPFAVWALSGGNFPLAISVLQVLALDIGTDMLPALALGVEPPSPRLMRGKDRSHPLINRALLTRAFGILGPVEAAVSLAGFTVVLVVGGWAWGEVVWRSSQRMRRTRPRGDAPQVGRHTRVDCPAVSG